MRVTNQTLQQRRVRELMLSQQRLETAQTQVSTGRRVLKPSDDPGAIGSILRLRTEASALAQRKSDLTAASNTLKATETTLGEMTGSLREAKTLALQANNGSAGPDERRALATQVNRLRDQLLTAGNHRLNNRSLFAGVRTDAAAFSKDAAGVVTYEGDTAPLQTTVAAGSSFDISFTGDRILDRRDGNDLFANLSALSTAIAEGNTAGITSGMARLEEDLSNLTTLRGDAGSRSQYLETALSRTESQIAFGEAQQSALENVDFAEAVLAEKSAETAQQASLAMTARLGGLSLLDYLR